MSSTDLRPGTTTVLRPRTADEHMVADLQRNHGRGLFGFLLRLTDGDRQRAEDLVQETLVRVWQHPEVLESGHESLRPWLFTVARRLAINAHRHRQARPAEVGADILDAAPPLVADHVDRSVVAMDVREAVKRLGPAHRAVLVQLYFRNRSVAEAAKVLGIPEGTVKSRAYHALRSLRKALPGYVVTP